MKKLFGIAISILFLSLLSGCYETHQEFWFEEDFSGRIQMRMELKGKLALMLISQNGVNNIDTLSNRQFIENQGGVRVLSLKTESVSPGEDEIPSIGGTALQTDPGGLIQFENEADGKSAAEELQDQAKITYFFELEFDSLDDLQGLRLLPEDQNSQGQNFSPAPATVVIKETEEGVLFRSEIQGPAATGSIGVPEDAFKDAQQTVTFHFATQIIGSNADEVSKDGKSAYFRMNPAEYINDVKPIEVLITKPGAALQIPVVPIASGLGVLLLVTAAFYLGRRSARATPIP